MQGTTLGCKPDLITGDRSPQTRCPLGTGLKTDVPIDEIGDMFGYDGHLPLSKVKMLFVTGSYPVVQRELIRVGVDIDVTPVMSTWPNKPVAIRVRMGGRYLPLDAMTDGGWTEKNPVSRPKQRERKIASTAIA